MKRLGQHFLKDKKIIKKIIEPAELKKNDFVVEIGAGHGEITVELIKKNIEVLAVEKDKKLFKFLNQKLGRLKNLKILNKDILKIIGNLPKLIPSNKKFKIVGNIPYYITGRLLRKIGELEVKPEICVFTLQKEVAERICAQPPNFNRLSAILGFWAECQIIKIVPRQFFSPKPRVDSAIILLKSKNNFKEVDFKKYCFLVNILFRQPRKTILNNLLFLSKNKKRWLNLLNILKIPPLDRPQKLNIYQIINLVKLI